MVTRIQKSGRDGVLAIAPLKQVRGKRSLEELVSKIRKGYRPRETAWGEPVGKEAW